MDRSVCTELVLTNARGAPDTSGYKEMRSSCGESIVIYQNTIRHTRAFCISRGCPLAFDKKKLLLCDKSFVLHDLDGMFRISRN